MMEKKTNLLPIQTQSDSNGLIKIGNSIEITAKILSESKFRFYKDFQGKLLKVQKVKLSKVSFYQNEVFTFFINYEKDHLILIEDSGVFQVYDLNTLKKLFENKSIYNKGRDIGADMINFTNGIFYILDLYGNTVIKYDYLNDLASVYQDPQSVTGARYYQLYHFKHHVKFCSFYVINWNNVLITGFEDQKENAERGFCCVVDNESLLIKNHLVDIRFSGFRKYLDSIIAWNNSSIYKMFFTNNNFQLVKLFSDLIIQNICVCDLNHRLITYCNSFYRLSESKIKDETSHYTSTINIYDLQTLEKIQEIQIDNPIDSIIISKCQKYLGVILLLNKELVIFDTYNFQSVVKINIMDLMYEKFENEVVFSHDNPNITDVFIDYPNIIIGTEDYLIKIS